MDAINSITEFRTAQNCIHEPAGSGVGSFKDVWQTVINAGGALLSSVISGQAGKIFNNSGSDLIAAQVEMQKEMQVTSMVSNIEKSKHESKMAAIRNIRVN